MPERLTEKVEGKKKKLSKARKEKLIKADDGIGRWLNIAQLTINKGFIVNILIVLMFITVFILVVGFKLNAFIAAIVSLTFWMIVGAIVSAITNGSKSETENEERDMDK